MSPSLTSVHTLGPFLRHRRDDRQPLGGVVQREAEDQQRAEGRLAQCEGGPDREPLTEVVQPDADRDHQREHPAGGGAVLAKTGAALRKPGADDLEQRVCRGGGQREQRHALVSAGQGVGAFERLERAVEKKEPRVSRR